MIRRVIDVHIFITDGEIKRLGGEASAEQAIKSCREKAISEAEKLGGNVVPTFEPSFHAAKAIDPVLGHGVALATRWHCDLPDSASAFMAKID